MTTWSKGELRKIGESDDLHISPFREDGKTYGTPTWIWSVVVEDALYVRAYNGRRSRWYRAAMRQKAGRHCGEESVSVAVEEIKAQDWAAKVYKPDIQANWDKLHKKPGYGINDF